MVSGEGVLSREFLKAGVKDITCWALKDPKGKSALKIAELAVSVLRFHMNMYV